MKKVLTTILSALLLTGMTTAAVAFEKDVDYVVIADSIDSAAYPYSTTEGWPACETGTLLNGTIIAGGTAEKNSTEGHDASLAFDGDPATYFEIFEMTAKSYVALVLDQAYELTQIRVTPASGQPLDRLHGMTIQGSNDGETWINVVMFRQDAHGTDTHIFTSQTITDQAYIDAGYNVRADESVFWVGKGESFSMYRIVNLNSGCQLSIGEVEFYGVAKEATVLNAETINTFLPSTNYFPNNINIRSAAEVVSVDGSLTGTVIGAGGTWNKNFYEYAFDGNNKKAFDPSYRGPQNWVGLLLDEPHALTSVRILPKRGAYANLEGAYIQGSLDGINWVNLVQLTAEDVPEKQNWVEKTVTDTNGYTYFRYVTSNLKHGDVADILLFGAPAAAATDIPSMVTPRADLSVYNGEIIDTGVAVVPVAGSIGGTVIGAGEYYLNQDTDKFTNGFDGDITTHYLADLGYGMRCWAGIKADAAVAVTAVRLMPNGEPKNIEGLVAQGSNDGINWTTLAEFTAEDIPAEKETYITKEITDTTAYAYFRINGIQLANTAFCEAQFFAGEILEETAAPETAAPETAAPETAAPETAAPETAAPETAAPETAAPETAAPETNAPETANAAEPGDDADDASNTGLIIGIVVAAVAVVAIVAGVIVKKKK